MGAGTGACARDTPASIIDTIRAKENELALARANGANISDDEARRIVANYVIQKNAAELAARIQAGIAREDEIIVQRTEELYERRTRGIIKSDQELATAEANPRHFIVRSSWLFGAGGGNFVETMLRLGRERDELRVVHDQIGCPTFAGHLAKAIVELARTDEYGIHHLAGAGKCSWCEFARDIFERAGVDCRVEPCTTHEYPLPARRPEWSVLGSERGRSLPAWQDGLDAYLGVRA